MTISDRIMKIIAREGVSMRAFETGIGASNGVLRKSMNLKNGISSKWIANIVEKYPQYSSRWLLTGEGEMIRCAEIEEHQVITHVAETKTPEKIIESQTIPLYNSIVQAGILSSLRENEGISDYISVPGMPRCDAATPIWGDSMYPILKAGDIVAYSIVHDISMILWGQMYIVEFRIGDDEYLSVKWIQKSKKGDEYVCLASENQHHDPVDIPRSSITGLAIVKFSMRAHVNF